MNFSGKQILVLGLGDTGLSMALYFTRHGARVRVADSRAQPPMAARLAEAAPDAVLHLGPFQAASFQGIDLIAISPGVNPREPLVAKAVNNGIPLAGDMELFGQVLASQSSAKKITRIGITGSNGKSTVTAMVGAMCRQAGLKTIVAGNIGLPVLDAWMEAEDIGQPDVYVLELSSFQLETTSSLSFDAATVLNISEDHMDRYASVKEYAAAKMRIFIKASLQVINRDDPHVLAMMNAKRPIRSFGSNRPAKADEWGIIEAAEASFLAEGETRLMPVADLPLAGRHNAANALAALALARAIDLPYSPLLEALRHFKGLPHRVEKVAEIAGVSYFDDSKGTNVGATVAALMGIGVPVVLIAGGDGKSQDFSPLKDAVARYARAVILIGRDAPMIDSAICASQVSIEHASSLKEAVQRAASLAQPGDAVLLSPACASFDMFRNYVHRAEIFVSAVMELRPQPERANVL